MNIVSGEIDEIFIEDGAPMAKMKIEGTTVRVSLMFLTEARVGDTILIESGLAISNVRPEKVAEN